MFILKRNFTTLQTGNFENYSVKSNSPYQQLNSIGRQTNATPTSKPASPFQRVNGSQLDTSQTQQQPVKVILSNGNNSISGSNNSTSGSSYKSTIENKVKLLSQNHQNQQTYVSNMHVRVPSQESSIYGDSRTYINLGQPKAIATKAGILLNPSNSQLKLKNRETAKVPAIPRSQVVKSVMEPSYSSLLQNQGEQNQVREFLMIYSFNVLRAK